LHPPHLPFLLALGVTSTSLMIGKDARAADPPPGPGEATAQPTPPDSTETPPSAPTPPTALSPTEQHDTTVLPAPSPSGWSPQKTWGVALVGVGGASLIAGGVLGWLAHQAWNSAKTDCATGCGSGSAAQGEASDAHRDATASNITFAVGAAGVAIGAILWATAPKKQPVTAVRVVPFVASGAGGVFAVGSLP
jgi:hypothetical protein